MYNVRSSSQEKKVRCCSAIPHFSTDPEMYRANHPCVLCSAEGHRADPAVAEGCHTYHHHKPTCEKEDTSKCVDMKLSFDEWHAVSPSSTDSSTIQSH